MLQCKLEWSITFELRGDWNAVTLWKNLSSKRRQEDSALVLVFALELWRGVDPHSLENFVPWRSADQHSVFSQINIRYDSIGTLEHNQAISMDSGFISENFANTFFGGYLLLCFHRCLRC